MKRNLNTAGDACIVKLAGCSQLCNHVVHGHVERVHQLLGVIAPLLYEVSVVTKLLKLLLAVVALLGSLLETVGDKVGNGC